MGAPHIQPKLYAFLKDNPGKQFSSAEIAKALQMNSESSISWSLKSLCKKHPAVLKRIPIGKTGRLALYEYSPVHRNGASSPKVEASPGDVLITIPLDAGRSETLTLLQARKIYDQLHAVFGSGGK